MLGCYELACRRTQSVSRALQARTPHHAEHSALAYRPRFSLPKLRSGRADPLPPGEPTKVGRCLPPTFVVDQ